MEVCCGRVHYTCQCFYSISTLQKLSLNVIYNRHDWYGCKLHFSPVINSTWIYLMLLPMWSWQTQTSNRDEKLRVFGLRPKSPKKSILFSFPYHNTERDRHTDRDTIRVSIICRVPGCLLLESMALHSLICMATSVSSSFVRLSKLFTTSFAKVRK